MPKFENLSLKQMAVQFAAPIPPLTKRITRRSSYAQAGGICNSMATDPVIQAAPSADSLRTQSLSETSVPPTARLLRHPRSDVSAMVRLRGTSTHQMLPDHDNASLSQAGLDAVDAIAENENWEGCLATTSIPFHEWLSHRNHSQITKSHEAISRRSSIRLILPVEPKDWRH